MRVLSVVGARPQFVKSLPVSEALRERHDEVLVHTGQHYDEYMSEVFFEELDIPEPAYNLGVGSASHGVQTARMLTGIEELVETETPDVVLVYGDTNSTLAGALAGAKTDPLVAHVEAGLRSHDREMPEETNRVVTDHVSDLLFVPTDRARENLQGEGITEGVHWTGDVMLDTLQWARDRALDHATALSDLELDPGSYLLATVHRAGNTDDEDALTGIVEALARAPSPVVFPAHPRTKERLRTFGLWEDATNRLTVIEPVGYLDFIQLLDGATAVATDSGGVQKEAYFLGTPCVTLREETEWPETVEAGWNWLVGADPDRIEDALTGPEPPESRPDLYGDGAAAARVVDALETRTSQ